MKGEKVVEEREFIIYTGEFFLYRIVQKVFDKYVEWFGKKGVSFVEAKLGDIIQRQMKKTTDMIVEGEQYQADYEGLLNEVVGDIKDEFRAKNGSDLNDFGKEEKEE